MDSARLTKQEHEEMNERMVDYRLSGEWAKGLLHRYLPRSLLPDKCLDFYYH